MANDDVSSARQPLSHQAQARIRQFIGDQRLRPGDSLPSEGEFCQMLGMSKASVREGIRRLEMLGIVDVRHGRGLFVGEFSLDPLIDALPFKLLADDTPLREILQVRAAIEEGLIVHAAGAMTDNDLNALDELVGQMRAHSVEGEVAPEVDRAFHLALFAPLNNSMLNKLIETFWVVYARSSAEAETAINRHAVEDHAEIVAALRAEDPERARRAVAIHFAPIQSSVEPAPSGAAEK